MTDKERDVWQAHRSSGLGALANMLATGKRGHDLGSDLMDRGHPIHKRINRKASGGSIENTTHDRKLI